MKKIFAIVSISALVLASCSKKEENKLMDSNTMMEEPEVIVTDTIKAKPETATPTTEVQISVATDSTAAK